MEKGGLTRSACLIAVVGTAAIAMIAALCDLFRRVTDRSEISER